MCGFTGIFSPDRGLGDATLTAVVTGAAETLSHRGPDADGVWVDEDAGIALGHRRLSILDLSPLGHQPMTSANGRFVIAYNGEIYNFRELRQELEDGGCSFRGNSDTEVLLAAISHWGLTPALERANGMFAFALWDRETRTLYLVRDRVGQKPLYYGWAGNALVFGSELKALRRYDHFSTTVDTGALTLLLRHGAIPAPCTIYCDCWKLSPGSVLTIGTEEIAARALPQPQHFWSATEVAKAGLAGLLDTDDTSATDALDGVLRDAVGACMVSDVPLGAFLSGGIDSSTVVALMQAQSDRPVKTFSIGFIEDNYNEAVDAAAVAAHLGTDHTELYVAPSDAQSVIPQLPKFYDEPFADPSQIPTYLVSRLAHQQVTVSLSGDGGDETFGGYNRHTWAKNLNRTIGLAPLLLRRLLRRLMEGVPPHRWDAISALVAPVVPSGRQHGQVGDKVHKFAEIIDSSSREEMYWRLISQWKQPCQAIPHAIEPDTLLSDRTSWPDLPEFAQQIMLLDTMSYLPNDILVKLDRASMAVSLECRVPFLDHNVVEFAWRLPTHQKIRNGTGKWILRQVLARYVPQEMFERPKMGFGVPIGDWLRGDLREWAEDLLSHDRLRQSGLFQTEIVRSLWAQHLRGDRNTQYQLWPVLMFEAWRDTSH